MLPRFFFISVCSPATIVHLSTPPAVLCFRWKYFTNVTTWSDTSKNTSKLVCKSCGYTHCLVVFLDLTYDIIACCFFLSGHLTDRKDLCFVAKDLSRIQTHTSLRLNGVYRGTTAAEGKNTPDILPHLFQRENAEIQWCDQPGCIEALCPHNMTPSPTARTISSLYDSCCSDSAGVGGDTPFDVVSTEFHRGRATSSHYNRKCVKALQLNMTTH